MKIPEKDLCVVCGKRKAIHFFENTTHILSDYQECWWCYWDEQIILTYKFLLAIELTAVITAFLCLGM